MQILLVCFSVFDSQDRNVLKVWFNYSHGIQDKPLQFHAFHTWIKSLTTIPVTVGPE